MLLKRYVNVSLVNKAILEGPGNLSASIPNITQMLRCLSTVLRLGVRFDKSNICDNFIIVSYKLEKKHQTD